METIYTFFLVAVLSLYLLLQLISRSKVSGLIGGYFRWYAANLIIERIRTITSGKSRMNRMQKIFTFQNKIVLILS